MTDPLASGREVILFDNAGVGRSTGHVPETIAGMAGHAIAFVDGLGIQTCDVFGLFQYPESFTRHAEAFLSSDSESAVF